MEKEEYVRMFTLESEHWWYVSLHDICAKYVSDFTGVNVKKKIKIFDAGCGTGRMMELLSGFGSVEGIDWSPDAVSFCKKRGLSGVSRGNLNTYVFKKKYDIIICNDVLYHSAIKSDSAVIDKFYKALKPGGMLILHLAAFDILKRNHDTVVQGARRYRRKPSRLMLERSGFAVVKASYRMSFLFFPLLFIKLIENRISRHGAASDLKTVQPMVNKIALLAARIENFILRFVRIPFGSSLFIVSKKV